MTEVQQKFIDLLKEMFQFDQADLDFGIYRIMNAKHDEIEKFLEKDLPAEIDEGLKAIKNPASAEQIKKLEEDLAKAKEWNLKDKIEEIENQLKMIKSNSDSSAAENDIYNQLLDFFSRYYDEGDFISQRRYSKGKYAIPYEGEEVKLHWANADQYYIKTSEYFKDYTFSDGFGNKVHFKILDAETEQNNNKSKDKKFFQLTEQENKFEIIDGELYIYVKYKTGTLKQKAYNTGILEAFTKYANDNISEYQKFISLTTKERGQEVCLLEKQLNTYTAKNTFDYFIHKDLRGFLTQELDFYIKNEIIRLDDIDETDEVKTKLILTKAKVLHTIAKKIIAFLAQLEDFQKKLFLKKKFVTETNYCITLDRIDESFYAEIAANEEQRKEWIELFKINEITATPGDLLNDGKCGYSEPLTEQFLKENPYLVLDTVFFTAEFKEKLIASIDNLEEKLGGLLICSENFQALNLLQAKYQNKINAIITDPPYNTDNDDFLYKDNYSHSSWLSMIKDRFDLGYSLLKDKGWCSIDIDDNELFNLEKLLEVDSSWSSITNLTVKMSHLSGMKMSHIEKKIPKIKESILLLSKGEDYEMNPIYEQCSWEEAFERYTSWVDFNGSENPNKWTRKTLRQAAKEANIDINNEQEFTDFCIENANHIFQRAKNDTVSDFPHDGIFYEHISANGLKKIVLDAKEVLFVSNYLREINGKKIPVQPKGDIWDDIGINNAHNEGGVQLPNGKKPVKLFERLIELTTNENATVLDMFAGSGTTAHAIIELSKNKPRKYILIQDGFDYFNEKTKRRVENVMYSSEWKLDKPVSREGSSHAFKYIRLESYEDTLNNITLKSAGEGLLDSARKDYFLNYMMDFESKESDCLLNIEKLSHPFDYTMKITRSQECKEQKIDLVETFNYLIGLTVTSNGALQAYDATFSIDTSKPLTATIKSGTTYRIKMIEGTNRAGERVLVIWRDLTGDIEKDNAVLDAFFAKKHVNPLDFEYKTIYVNGDNNLQNIKTEDENWKVILIESEMKKRMFSEQ